MIRLLLHECVSFLLLLVLLGSYVPPMAIHEDDLCRRHENCSCKASECTCKDEEIHRYDVDQCTVSSDDCALIGKNQLFTFVFDGFISAFSSSAQITDFTSILEDSFSCPSSLMVFEVFHPPNA